MNWGDAFAVRLGQRGVYTVVHRAGAGRRAGDTGAATRTVSSRPAVEVLSECLGQGSAKGFCFLSLEDETGTVNAILTPDVFKRFRAPLHENAIVQVEGPLQKVDGVIHVRVRNLIPVPLRRALPKPRHLPASHDYR